jgi:hypothetical protein
MQWRKKTKKKALWTTLPSSKLLPDPKGKKKAKYTKSLEKDLYRKEAREFINRLSSLGFKCPVMRIIFSKVSTVSEVHHRNGRRGNLLRYKPYWIPVSREGHNWIHNNIEAARGHGWICATGLWNKPA